ncbi:MAG: DUF6103 family protein [Eubacteriales bacterium]|nr:DUF6103 family protein [Eubacteriales bacterium]
MKTTQIQLRFDAAKLKALEFYLPNNGTTVEEELHKKFDDLYDNEVPQSVKDFLKFQSGDHSAMQDQENGAEQSDAPAKDKPSRKQKSSPKAEAVEEAPAMVQTM